MVRVDGMDKLAEKLEPTENRGKSVKWEMQAAVNFMIDD